MITNTIADASRLDMDKIYDPQNAYRAAKILVDECHKHMIRSIVDVMKNNYDREELKKIPEWSFIKSNERALNDMLDFNRDYLFDYVAFKKCQESYLLKNESPQHMFLRVAIATTKDNNLDEIKKKYDALSQHYYIHGTPTLVNACKPIGQLASCFLIGVNDNIEDIMDTLKNTAIISKHGGGIGLWYSDIRSKNHLIKSTHGWSSGIVKQIRLFDANMICWDQGGKRPGAMAIYLEPWHGDIYDFLDLKKHNGSDMSRARNLHYALFVPDLFMERFKNGETLSLFSPHVALGLTDTYDGMKVYENGFVNLAISKQLSTFVDAWKNLQLPEYFEKIMSCKDKEPSGSYTVENVFSDLYHAYEKSDIPRKVEQTAKIMRAICELQRDTGNPFIMFKDHVNRQSNHANIGTIKSSNLCTEIMQYSDNENYSTCTLASINLKKFWNGKEFDFVKLSEIVELITDGLDTIIDKNKYPVKKAEKFSKDVRAIGIGIQGLANLLCMMRIPYISKEAFELERKIFETIYLSALKKSCDLAEKYGKYKYFEHSDISRGLINGKKLIPQDLQDRINKVGVRNSLLVAVMPTVSTSVLLNNNDSFEPFMYNVFVQESINGKTLVINEHMIEHLTELGLWNESIINRVINNNGSIQNIPEIPSEVKEIYKTAWEIKQKDILNKVANFAVYVDQGISLNLHFSQIDDQVYANAIYYAYHLGLKNGNYYVRSRPAKEALKIAVDKTKIKQEENEPKVCSLLNPNCESCSG